MHGHLDVLDTGVGQAEVGDALGEGLDQPDRLPRDEADDALGKTAVVDGVGQVVAPGRRSGVDAESDVDAELLAVLAFVLPRRRPT